MLKLKKKEDQKLPKHMYNCSTCNATFKSKRDLSAHVDRVHLDKCSKYIALAEGCASAQ